ncbi:adenylyl cyclase [Asanoa siamensis]|uniref:Coagulation factor 5/8 type n=1 Tax=Asanoa siamensis TaxID=926357 RepID=A0ABQ4D2C5_9ACTN|nr:adenylyl cyclase [Asanoa siamensis]GIF77673.1 coagulation factor 5/8 type [Asanoa siamensis]
MRTVRLLAVATTAATLTAAGVFAMPGSAAAHRGGPDFGPNVFVYDPGTPAAQIQAKFDELFAAQEKNEMGTNRYAVLFKPGHYDVNARLGYYTTVSGLGRSPADVDITGAVRVTGQVNPNVPGGVSALTNFWRSAENFTVTPTDWSNQWAVSQASPMRRVHVKGILWLEPGNGGYSSGGFIANSKVDGITINGSQQQWLTRDSELGDAWTNGVWNQVFSGVTGAPPTGFPNPPYTTLASSPVTREKPFLYVDGRGKYKVFVPALQRDTAGTTWSDGDEPGSAIDIDDFFIAKPTDSAARINLALALGKHLLLTPGVYHLDRPLRVLHKNTVVLGLGMPSLAPDTGEAALKIADVDGVKVAGVLVDAGARESDTLIEVGSRFSRRDHSRNPTSLQDVFIRIGGPWVGRAKTSLVVNSDDTLLENIWAWRGDHGNGIGWTQNTGDVGVVVNGDDVTAYGLFVEHYQKWQTIWNGERGRTIFYQSEMPYDPPSQAAWTSPTGKGWASYKVAPSVRTHEAWGLGVYTYFNQGVDIRAARGIEVPDRAGVRFHNMITVFLDGSGGVERTINDAGTPCVGSFSTSALTEYPA